MSLITWYNEFANIIDQCDDEEALKQFQNTSSISAMQRSFWEQRKVVFNETDPLEKRKAIIKLQWLQQFFGCSIAITGNVRKFTAPRGLYGIVIAPGAVVEDNCVIFQQVYIGPDTLKDSKHAGFPVIGNNVYIGAGAKIVGNVVIGDNVRIDPNCCIMEDIPKNSHVMNNGTYVIQPAQMLDNQHISASKYMEEYFDVPARSYSSFENLHVEAARKEDLETIIKMYKDRMDWFKWKKIRQWLFYLVHHPKEEFLEKIQNGDYYVIKDGMEIVAGFSLSTDSENWEDDSPNALYLSRSITRTDCKGLGVAIVYFAKKIALDSRKSYLRLECVYKNEKLNQIWENLGFAFVRDVENSYHASLREMKLSGDAENLPVRG